MLRPVLLIGLALNFWVLASSALSLEKRVEGASEYKVKALFLYNFAKFVDWPASSFASPQDHFKVCVVGDDPFGDELDQAVQGKTINNRHFTIRRVSKPQDVRSCHIAFISSPDERRVRKLLEELHPASVLTVGDGHGFTEWGGILKFTLEGNKVRFEINVDAAEHARLKISSQLLSLAKSIIRKGKS